MLDLSSARIPNLIILMGMISGICYRILCLEERNIPVLALGILIPVFLFFPLFVFRAMGAGDIKLMAVTGAFFTIGENLKCMIFAIMIGGVIALIKIILNQNMRQRFLYLFRYMSGLLNYASAGEASISPYIDVEDENTVKSAGIKFSLPIFMGAMIVMGGGL